MSQSERDVSLPATQAKQSLVVQRLEQARSALAEARTLREKKIIRDGARALELYARRQSARSAQDEAAVLAILAERALGLDLQEVQRSGGGRPSEAQERRYTEYQQALDELGVSRVTAGRWQHVAEIANALVEGFFEECRTKDKPITTAGLLAVWKAQQEPTERTALYETYAFKVPLDQVDWLDAKLAQMQGEVSAESPTAWAVLQAIMTRATAEVIL